MTLALQDITDKMGESGVCPGTQQCARVNIPAAQANPFTITLSQGDGFLHIRSRDIPSWHIHSGMAWNMIQISGFAFEFRPDSGACPPIPD
jgi:hypothetical protein